MAALEVGIRKRLNKVGLYGEYDDGLDSIMVETYVEMLAKPKIEQNNSVETLKIDRENVGTTETSFPIVNTPKNIKMIEKYRALPVQYTVPMEAPLAQKQENCLLRKKEASPKNYENNEKLATL